MFGKKTKCLLLDTFVRSSSLKIEDTMPTFQSVGNFRVLSMLLNRFFSDAEITSQFSSECDPTSKNSKLSHYCLSVIM